MSPDESGFRALLQAALDQLWKQSGQPVLGSALKLKVLELAQENGLEFDEHAFGYQNFGALLSSCDFARVKYQLGTDILVVPSEQAAALDEGQVPLPRIRPEFWKAFLTFPREDLAVAYDRNQDKVLRHAPSEMPAGVIAISPVSKEEQLRWRRDFLTSLGETLLNQSAFTLEGDFRAFSDALASEPKLWKVWGTYKLRKVYEKIFEWAEKNEIPHEIWTVPRSSVKRPTSELRSKLYKILDTIPVDNLLEVTIPLRWLVRRDK